MPLQPGAGFEQPGDFRLGLCSRQAGMFDMALRIFPQNPMLPHRMDFALVKWA